MRSRKMIFIKFKFEVKYSLSAYSNLYNDLLEVSINRLMNLFVMRSLT